jgi:cytoskeletal protein CcmA (bactofilin family)
MLNSGNVACQKIFIEDGAVFNGSCKMIEIIYFEELAKQKPKRQSIIVLIYINIRAGL